MMTEIAACNVLLDDEKLARVTGGATLGYSRIMKEYCYPADMGKAVMRPTTPGEIDRFRADVGAGKIIDMTASLPGWAGGRG